MASDLFTIAWNTGAKYTAQGQRIGATLDGDRVVFADIDRCINGVFVVERPLALREVAALRAEVMRRYLHNTYRLFADVDLAPALAMARQAASEHGQRGEGLRGRALAVIENARAAGCRVDAGNVVDLLADNIPAKLSELREVAASLDLPPSDAGAPCCGNPCCDCAPAPAAEGFRIYIPSREALEALERAVNDELTRATDSMNVWTNRAAQASADKWRGECVRLVEISRQRTEALLVALLAIRRQDG